MKELLIKPKYDIIFKCIFGDERNKKILCSFLCSVLQISKDKLAELQILNTEILPNYKNEKNSILDLKIRLKSKEIINVEIQILPYVNMEARILYYWSSIYHSQLDKGQYYSDLKKCISIIVLDYNFTDEKKAHNVYHIKNNDSFKIMFRDLEIHTLELRKVREEQDDLLNLWLQFISANSKEVLEMVSLKDEDIKRAYEVLAELNKNPKLKAVYEAREKYERDYVARMAYMERKVKETELQLEQEREKGIKQGIEQGIKKGKNEEKIRVAINLLKKDLDINIISYVTGLSEEELNKIKRNLV